MKKIVLLTTIGISLLFVAFMFVEIDPASAFLSSLNENQRAKAQYTIMTKRGIAGIICRLLRL